jgi:putative sigma-54 modulation protein
MQLHVKGRNLEVSDPIRSYAERKLGKLDRQLSPLAEVEVELAVERNPSIADNQVAEATVRLKGHTLRAREASSDMKASIDELVENLVRQVKEAREKRRARRKAVDKQPLNGAEPPEI